MLLANIPNPTFVNGGIANPDIANPDIANPDIANLTIALAPGDTARITLRVVDPNRNDAVTFNAAQAVTPAVVAQAVNTTDVAAGHHPADRRGATRRQRSGRRAARPAAPTTAACSRRSRARGPSRAARSLRG